MLDWWMSLELSQQIFGCIAVPATLVLIIQTIILLIGMGGEGDADGDVDTETDAEDGDGLALFSVRGIVSMLAVMGWSAMALLETELPDAVAILISVVLGIMALILIAYVMRAVSRLQSSGNIDIGNAVGKVAQVYLPIPERGKGAGKVHITIQEQYCEFGAITTAEEKIPTGSYVRVVSVGEAGILVVEPLSGD